MQDQIRETTIKNVCHLVVRGVKVLQLSPC